MKLDPIGRTFHFMGRQKRSMKMNILAIINDGINSRFIFSDYTVGIVHDSPGQFDAITQRCHLKKHTNRYHDDGIDVPQYHHLTMH